MENGWRYIDHEGTFVLNNPHRINYLYFPLLNDTGMVSSITPLLNGDIKTGQNSYFSVPVSAEDLHNNRSARNFWLKINGKDVWSATGNSAAQVINRFSSDDEEVSLTAGILWHQVSRTNHGLGLTSEITNFVTKDDNIELMKVKIINIGIALSPLSQLLPSRFLRVQRIICETTGM